MTDRHVSPKAHRDPPTSPQPRIPYRDSWSDDVGADRYRLLDPDPLVPSEWEAARQEWLNPEPVEGRPLISQRGCAWCAIMAALAVFWVMVALLAAGAFAGPA